jgi:hypothetical protein
MNKYYETNTIIQKSSHQIDSEYWEEVKECLDMFTPENPDRFLWVQCVEGKYPDEVTFNISLSNLPSNLVGLIRDHCTRLGGFLILKLCRYNYQEEKYWVLLSTVGSFKDETVKGCIYQFLLKCQKINREKIEVMMEYNNNSQQYLDLFLEDKQDEKSK